jgi:hypothetical protein
LATEFALSWFLPCFYPLLIALHLQSCLPHVLNDLHSHPKFCWTRLGMGMWTAEHGGISITRFVVLCVMKWNVWIEKNVLSAGLLNCLFSESWFLPGSRRYSDKELFISIRWLGTQAEEAIISKRDFHIVKLSNESMKWIRSLRTNHC